MRVKIGDTWYDSHNEPICIQLSKEEREQFHSFESNPEWQGKYAQVPLGWMDSHDVLEWIKGLKDENTH